MSLPLFRHLRRKKKQENVCHFVTELWFCPMYNEKDVKHIQTGEFKACLCGWQKVQIIYFHLHNSA